MPLSRRASDDFFVGYLDAAAAGALPRDGCGVLLSSSACRVLYKSCRARGVGRLGHAGEVAYDGVLVARPYPVVLVPATGHEAGARGAVGFRRVRPARRPALLRSTAGRDRHRLSALRDGLVVLPAICAPRRAPGRRTPRSSADRAGARRRTLTGEIVDSKCYLGAMNPGAGGAACAGLCLIGGIPAFVTRDRAGASPIACWPTNTATRWRMRHRRMLAKP